MNPTQIVTEYKGKGFLQAKKALKDVFRRKSIKDIERLEDTAREQSGAVWSSE